MMKIRQNGFSLIEMILVIVLVSIMSAIAFQLLANGFSSFMTVQDVVEANWQGQVAMERMLRDIRAARSQVDLTTMTASDFAFTDNNGNAVEFKLSGGNLLRNTQVLATGVNSLTFTYYDRNGSTAAGTTDTHYVGVSINITESNSNYVLTSGAYLRDLAS